MNKKVFFAVSALAATFSFGFAQNPVQEVKLETAPDACLKYFNAQNSARKKIPHAAKIAATSFAKSRGSEFMRKENCVHSPYGCL